tara:strand:- start:140 stop:304 length:165 start_codon:yes stop_codon:yes gene_type:complete
MFDEEVIRNLEKMIPLIKSMKTAFDHVRGDVEAREIMVETLNRAIEIINTKENK